MTLSKPNHRLFSLACLLLLGGLILLQAGCAAASPSGSSPRTIPLNASGEAVSAHPGDILEVTLEANPSTGYIWEVEGLDETVLKMEGEPEAKSGANTNLVGAPVTQTFRYKALSAGRVELKLVYHRPWEKDVPPVKSFSAVVTIAE